MRHPVFCTLALDTRSERQIGWLRLVAAAGCLVGAGWIVAIAPPAKGYYCAGAGLLASLMWVGLWARGRRLIRRAVEHGLELAPEGLTLTTPDRTTTVAWSNIERIEADEDRLVVELTPHEGEPLSLMPRYGGLGLHALHAAIEAAQRQGCASGGRSLQLPSSASSAARLPALPSFPDDDDDD